MLPGLFLLPKRGVKVSLVVIFCSKRFSGDDICVYIYIHMHLDMSCRKKCIKMCV